MRYAETGFNLEVDLRPGNIERVETDPEPTAAHLRGQGAAAKVRWDRAPAEAGPFFPDDLPILSSRSDECGFCPASGTSRDFFKGPDSGLPLKCDMCETDPPLPGPMCVQACESGVLAYVEGKEDVTEEQAQKRQGEMETGLTAFIDGHGLANVLDAPARMSRKG